MSKRKLTKQEKAAEKLRQKEFMTIFIRAKQKRIRRPPMIEGLPVDEFIARNADPIWLHQNGLWELIEPEGGWRGETAAYSGSISSRTGSKLIRRRSTYEIFPKCDACAERCPISTSPFGS